MVAVPNISKISRQNISGTCWARAYKLKKVHVSSVLVTLCAVEGASVSHVLERGIHIYVIKFGEPCSQQRRVEFPVIDQVLSD